MPEGERPRDAPGERLLSLAPPDTLPRPDHLPALAQALAGLRDSFSASIRRVAAPARASPRASARTSPALGASPRKPRKRSVSIPRVPRAGSPPYPPQPPPAPVPAPAPAPAPASAPLPSAEPSTSAASPPLSSATAAPLSGSTSGGQPPKLPRIKIRRDPSLVSSAGSPPPSNDSPHSPPAPAVTMGKRKRAVLSPDDDLPLARPAAAAAAAAPRRSAPAPKVRAPVSGATLADPVQPSLGLAKPRASTSSVPPQPEPPVDPAWALPSVTPATIMPRLAHVRARRWKATSLYEVDDDFSTKDWRDRDRERDPDSVPPGEPPARSHNKKGKEAAQVPLQTFFTAVEPYFKSITEDDLAWLTSASHEEEADAHIFDIPPLGTYYRTQWEQEATALALANGDNPPPASEKKKAPAYNPSFTPAALSDRSWVTDDAASGPTTQRVVASLLPIPRSPSPSPPDEREEEDAPARTPLLGLRLKEVVPPSVTASLGQDVGTFESRLRDELDMLLGRNSTPADTVAAADAAPGSPADPSAPSDLLDDEVSSTLRRVQRALRGIRTVNQARKERLLEIAQKRMAYQEYLHGLASFEREIEQGWVKRQRQIRAQAAAGKRKKHHHHLNGVLGASETPGPSTPAGGGEPTTDSPLSADAILASGDRVVSEHVLRAIAKRAKWQAAFDAMFGHDPVWVGPPPEHTSVFDDLPVPDFPEAEA